MRRIDSKFHIDGEQIIKTSNGDSIPTDEPLFLLRGRDRLALPLLRLYEVLSEVDGCNDYHMNGLRTRIGDFAQFRRDNRERMKQPGITRGK